MALGIGVCRASVPVAGRSVCRVCHTSLIAREACHGAGRGTEGQMGQRDGERGNSVRWGNAGAMREKLGQDREKW